MKVIKKFNQHRRDLYAELECENCGNKEVDEYAYDDRNYWDNVIPERKCEKCQKSTNDLGIAVERVATKYSDFDVV